MGFHYNIKMLKYRWSCSLLYSAHTEWREEGKRKRRMMQCTDWLMPGLLRQLLIT